MSVVHVQQALQLIFGVHSYLHVQQLLHMISLCIVSAEIQSITSEVTRSNSEGKLWRLFRITWTNMWEIRTLSSKISRSAASWIAKEAVIFAHAQCIITTSYKMWIKEKITQIPIENYALLSSRLRYEGKLTKLFSVSQLFPVIVKGSGCQG